MDFQIRITETALADFEEILEYSWNNFPDTTERFGNELLSHIDLLKKFPFIGSRVEGRSGVRQLIHTPIMIYYRVNEGAKLVEILHFWTRFESWPAIGRNVPQHLRPELKFETA